MLIIGVYDLCQPDMAVMVPGLRILFRNVQADGVLRAVVNACHAHLTVFHYVDRSLSFQADTACRADSRADSAADTVLCHSVYMTPQIIRQ